MKGFRERLQELGYIEGQNIGIESCYFEAKFDRLPVLAADLVRLKVDVIVVAGGDPLIRTAKSATKTIPIVMTGLGSDPVRAGHVESLARPGGNVTGITLLDPEFPAARQIDSRRPALQSPYLASTNAKANGEIAALQAEISDRGAVSRSTLIISPFQYRSASNSDRRMPWSDRRAVG